MKSVSGFGNALPLQFQAFVINQKFVNRVVSLHRALHASSFLQNVNVTDAFARDSATKMYIYPHLVDF